MSDAQKITMLRQRIIYLSVLYDKAQELGEDYATVAATIQAQIAEKSAQLAELTE